MAAAYGAPLVIWRTDENWIIVPRSGVTLKDAYADIRQWSVKEWREHPELMRDLVKAGRAEVIGSELTDRILDELTRNRESRNATNRRPTGDDGIRRRESLSPGISRKEPWGH
ncbi:MAG: hypothetical protein U0872_07455 [Planctomycetaceae bacterium]